VEPLRRAADLRRRPGKAAYLAVLGCRFQDQPNQSSVSSPWSIRCSSQSAVGSVSSIRHADRTLGSRSRTLGARSAVSRACCHDGYGPMTANRCVALVPYGRSAHSHNRVSLSSTSSSAVTKASRRPAPALNVPTFRLPVHRRRR
jgi:hypothetical protein